MEKPFFISKRYDERAICIQLQTAIHLSRPFGSFTYSYGQIDQVYNYIKNQEAHHNHVPFLEEYETMLNKYKVDYEERYIFKEPE